MVNSAVTMLDPRTLPAAKVRGAERFSCQDLLRQFEFCRHRSGLLDVLVGLGEHQVAGAVGGDTGLFAFGEFTFDLGGHSGDQ